MPSAAISRRATQLQELLRDAGVNDDTLIVFYGDNDNWFAAWAYWQLKYQGLDNARLLDGGRKKVEAAGLPLTHEPADSPARQHHPPLVHANGAADVPQRRPGRHRRPEHAARRRPFAGRVRG